MARRRRTGIVFGIPIVMLVILIGFSMFWLKATTQMEDFIKNEQTEWAKAGIEFSFKNKKLKGFPYSACVILENAVFKMPARAGGWEMAFKEIEMNISVFSSQKITITPHETIKIKTSDKPDASLLRVKSDTLYADISINSFFNIVVADIVTEKLYIKGYKSGGKLKLKNFSFSMKRYFKGNAKTEDKTYDIFMDAEDMDVTPELGLPLGENMSKMVIEAYILGPFDLENIMSGLERWRADGGTINLEKFQLSWKPLKIHLNGTLALDNAFQPIGTLIGNSIGFFEALESFVDTDIVRTRDASMIKVVIGKEGISKTKKGLSKNGVSLSIQDNIVYIGPVKLLELPFIDWTFGVGSKTSGTKKKKRGIINMLK